MLQAPEQIDDDGDVHDDGYNLQRAEMAHEMINLEGNERRRDDDGENLRPTLEHQQPHSFHKEQAGIKERGRADERQIFIVDMRGFADQGAEIAARPCRFRFSPFYAFADAGFGRSETGRGPGSRPQTDAGNGARRCRGRSREGL